MGVYVNGGVYWLSYTPYRGAKQVKQSTGLKVGSRVTRLDGSTVAAKQEAEAIYAKIIAQIREGKWFPDANQADCTMEELKRLWLDREKTKSKTSKHKDDVQLDVIIEVFGKDRLVSSLTDNDISQLRDHLSKRVTRYGTPYTQSTINHYFAVLRASLRYARKKGKTVRDSALLSIETPDPRNERDRICSPEEYRKLIQVIEESKGDNWQLVLALKIAYRTPLRLGAIVSLKWGQIDLTAGVARITPAVADNKARPVLAPLGKDALEALKARPRPINPETPVFTSTSERISQGFKYFVEKAQINDLHFHDLKHTALTNAANSGLYDIRELQAMSGHRTLHMLARYLHPSEDKLRSSMAKLEALEAAKEAAKQ
jgi:integrase